MSSMLEQAIVDASALREAALKNAEQSVIEKYAPEIKAAVDSLLEGDVKDEVLQEQDLGSVATSEPSLSSVEAPFAAAGASPNQEVEMAIEFEFDPEDFQMDLGKLKQQQQDDPASAGEQPEDTGELIADLGLDTEDEAAGDLPDEEELALQEILDVLSQTTNEEVIEEELIVDMGQEKGGWIETNEATLQYQQEMELAKKESTKHKEDNEELEKKVKELQESIGSFKTKNKELYSAVKQLKNRLDESLLSNAKLIYSNRILSDASLNERQKHKIVEAIAQAKSSDEAKTLCETLKATVGTTNDSGPKSLSESVQRKSNLSSILPRRKKEINENLVFSDRMKRLAGIS